jgi:hypothetical protein
LITPPRIRRRRIGAPIATTAAGSWFRFTGLTEFMSPKGSQG